MEKCRENPGFCPKMSQIHWVKPSWISRQFQLYYRHYGHRVIETVYINDVMRSHVMWCMRAWFTKKMHKSLTHTCPMRCCMNNDFKPMIFILGSGTIHHHQPSTININSYGKGWLNPYFVEMILSATALQIAPSKGHRDIPGSHESLAAQGALLGTAFNHWSTGVAQRLTGRDSLCLCSSLKLDPYMFGVCTSTYEFINLSIYQIQFANLSV